MLSIAVVDDERVIREGAAKVISDCMPNAEIVQCSGPTEALAEVEKKSFDIAFLDPPYGTGTLQKALSLLPPLMKPSGVIVCESPKGEELPKKSPAKRAWERIAARLEGENVPLHLRSF